MGRGRPTLHLSFRHARDHRHPVPAAPLPSSFPAFHIPHPMATPPPIPPRSPVGATASGSSQLLPGDWAVPALFRRRIGNRPGRQRAMVAEGHLLLILNPVPEAGSHRRKTAFFWRDPKGAWRSTASAEGLRSLQRLVEDYVQTANGLDERLEKEDDSAALFHEVVSRCVPVARAARNLHAALQEARQAVDDPELINLRDLAGEAERTLERGREDAKVGLEFLLARKSEEQAEQYREQGDIWGLHCICKTIVFM